MEQFHGYIELEGFWQHNFFYPLMFQEYIFSFAYGHGLKKFVLLETSGDRKFSLLVVKRLINRMYQQNFLILSAIDSNQNDFLGHKHDFYSQMLSEVFAVIVEIPLSTASLEKQKIVKSQNLRSIHSIFPFLEDSVLHLNFVLDILIPYPVHLEILVQTLRYWVKDASSLHLLRFFLYEYHNWNSLIKKKKDIFLFLKRTQRFFFFLYNFHVCEYESIFLFLCNQSSHLRSTSYRAFLERIFFYGKLEYLVKLFTKDFDVIFWLFKDPYPYSVRYKGKYIMASKGTSLLMHKLKFYLIYFWQCHFFVWSQARRIYINRLSTHSLDFMGFLSSVQLTSSVVRGQMLENAFIIDNTIKKFDPKIPISLLIVSLAKAKFCNGLGHPISKPIWIDLSDSVIIDRFGRICRNLFHYYSGSSIKKSLYRLKYILQSSCARTLARKHKSAVRAFLKRLGSEFFEEFLTEKEKVLSLILTKNSSNSRGFYRGCIWYLDIFCIHNLANGE
uniref:maturase K n=1 Tax=Pseudostellaria davidii TaxID=1137890 RepID=UPI002238EC1C|nr:maturase K [Pseudostellaria davidii]UYR20580.1 maturase K [Pseudostellaria davidii]